MMKNLALLLLPIAVAGEDVFHPTRISYDVLMSDQAKVTLADALSQVGMISITDIPDLGKKEALETLLECLEDDASIAIERTFPDGTHRRTMVTEAIGNAPEPIQDLPNTSVCQSFDQKASHFRHVVAKLTSTFSSVLVSALDIQDKDLVVTSEDIPYNLAQLVEQGHHLEHFHAYSSLDDGDNTNSDNDRTIDWHMDQGLVLIFSPGNVNGEPTEGFYIQLKDGSSKMVQFEPKDDLVFMLGDGVNQYVNPVLKSAELRAPPHALRMPPSTHNRVWYGRMVLPPFDALYDDDTTFGDVRQHLIEAAYSSSTTAIGCSSPTLVARDLSECDTDTQAACWHACMNYTDYDASPEICAERNLEMFCANEEGGLWDGTHNKEFEIRCLDPGSVSNITNDDGHGHSHDSKPPTTAPVTSAAFRHCATTTFMALSASSILVAAMF